MTATSSPRPLRDFLVEVAGVLAPELPTELLQRLQAQEARVRVAPHAPRVLVDHVLQVGTLGLDVEQLVHLLLVLDHGKAGLRVVDDVLHLPLDGVLVERHRDPAERLRGEHGPVELRAVVADDSRLVAAREADGGKAERDVARLFRVPAPAIGLPDAVALLADRDLGRQAPRIVQRELGEGVHLASGGRGRWSRATGAGGGLWHQLSRRPACHVRSAPRSPGRARHDLLGGTRRAAQVPARQADGEVQALCDRASSVSTPARWSEALSRRWGDSA